MRPSELGSLTKEPPLEKLDETIRAISPGMAYADLLIFARQNTHRDAPGLLRKRFLLIDSHDKIRYDRFLSLVHTEGINSQRVRKVMYFVWALRDERLRRFICEVVANEHGKWRIRELVKKTNAEFFRHWFPKPSTTPPKVRSNIEFFLTKAGIFDPYQKAVQLDLNDGWLMDAMQVVAQHESNPAQRKAMAGAPGEWLIARGWNGLANATAEELRTSVELTPVDNEPLEDDDLDVVPGSTTEGRKWVEYKIATSGKPPKQIITNEVARERASKSHLELERLAAAAAQRQGYDPRCNNNIDMYFKTPAGTVLAEMKSCHERNLHSQIRRGVGQLLEYQFVYGTLLGEPVAPLLVIETRPPGEKAWLVDYLRTLGITLAWKEPRGTRLLTTTAIPALLTGLVFPQA